MKKIIKMVIWVGIICLAVMYGLQVVDLINRFHGASVVELYERGIRTEFVDSTHYMPWKWLAWTLFQKPAILVVLVFIDDFIGKFNVKVERAA